MDLGATCTLMNEEILGPQMFSAPNRWLIVGLLFPAMAVSYIDRGNMAVAAPVLMREFRLSKTGIGVVLSVFFWAYALMQIPAGWLIDRFDVKITYAVGYTFWCLVAAGTSLVGSVGGLMLARGLLAVGESASTPASHRAICSMFSPRERGFPTGVYMAATKLGPAIGTALGAYFLVRFGWRGLFACTGLAGLLWLLPWLSLYPASPERVTREKKGQSSGSGLQKLLDPWRKRNIWGIFFGFFCYGYIWHVYDTWLPTYLVSERKMSLSQMGFWGPLPFVAFAISVSVGGLLADLVIARGWPVIFVRKAFIFVGLSIGMLIIRAGYATTAIGAVLLFTASTAGIGLATANIWVITQTLAPPAEVGMWTAIQNFGGSFGAGLAPLATGWLADATGSFVVPLTVAGGASALGILCYLLLITENVTQKGT